MNILLIPFMSIGLALMVYLSDAKAGRLALINNSKIFVYGKLLILIAIYILITILLISRMSFLPLGFIYSLILAILLIITVIDSREKLISCKALILLALFGLAAMILNPKVSVDDGMLAMLIMFIILWIINYLSRGSIGMGDVRLCSVLALCLGIEGALSMLALSMILCGIAAMVLMIIDKAYKNKSIAFAPFVTMSTIAILLS